MSLVPDRKNADTGAIALMVLLSAMWGFNQVAIKLAQPGIPLVMQACLRSAIAALLLLIWARARGIPLFDRDRTLWPGLSAGFLFAAEFAFIHAGLGHTSAARMIVFIYLAPVITAFGLALFIPGERLRPLQWVGVLLAFAGMATAFGEGFLAAQGSTWVGDLMGAIGALMWALTTILIRTTVLSNAHIRAPIAPMRSPTQVLPCAARNPSPKAVAMPAKATSTPAHWSGRRRSPGMKSARPKAVMTGAR